MAHYQVPGFEIKLPDAYTDLSTYVFALPPSPRFQPSFVVKAEPRADRPAVKQYAVQQVRKLQDALQGFALAGQPTVEVGERDTVAVVFDWGPAEETKRLRQKQWYVSVAEGSVVYTLTATNLAADFAQTESLFHAMFRSFRPK